MKGKAELFVFCFKKPLIKNYKNNKKLMYNK